MVDGLVVKMVETRVDLMAGVMGHTWAAQMGILMAEKSAAPLEYYLAGMRVEVMVELSDARLVRKSVVNLELL